MSSRDLTGGSRRESEDEADAPASAPRETITQVESPAARRQRPAGAGGTPSGSLATRSSGSSADSAGAVSSAEALFQEEVARTRVFARLALVLCLVVMAGLPFLGGHPTVRAVLMVALAGCALQSVWVVRAFRDPSRYRPFTVTALATFATATVFVGILYWGLFSVAPAAIVLGIYFFGRAQSRRASLFVYLLSAAAQGGLSALVLAGAMEDPGLYPFGHGPLARDLATQGLVQLVFFFAYVLARSTRASTLTAMEELQRAMRQVAQREAQLLEVRQDLDRALEIGGPGRFTDQLLGGYQLGPVIGRGGMAEVYEARNLASGEVVAVKLLHPTVAASPDNVVRFLREARAAGALASPHAVRVLHASDGAQPPHYLVLERLRGHDLAYYLRRRRRLPLDQLCWLVDEIGSVVDLAGRQGIVHRDLKPQNLFLDQPPDGPRRWKLLDFGVSKLGDEGGTLTRGHAVGTPSYMAPEQARSLPVDTRADLYALAGIVYRCITGQPPFSGSDIPGLLYQVVYEMPPQPSLLAAVPPEIDHVLAVGLAKDPADRFASAAELAQALAGAVAGQHDDWLARRAEALLAALPWGRSG